jgi:hypothetical protein
MWESIMNIQEMMRICDEATPGPWEKSPCGRDLGLSWDESHKYDRISRAGKADSFEDGDRIAPVFYDYEEAGIRPNDAAFIVAARTYLPKLIAVAEAAKKCQDDAQYQDQVGRCYMVGAIAFLGLHQALASLEADDA